VTVVDNGGTVVVNDNPAGGDASVVDTSAAAVQPGGIRSRNAVDVGVGVGPGGVGVNVGVARPSLPGLPGINTPQGLVAPGTRTDVTASPGASGLVTPIRGGASTVAAGPGTVVGQRTVGMGGTAGAAGSGDSVNTQTSVQNGIVSSSSTATSGGAAALPAAGMGGDVVDAAAAADAADGAAGAAAGGGRH
jgi:hypothetical protein